MIEVNQCRSWEYSVIFPLTQLAREISNGGVMNPLLN